MVDTAATSAQPAAASQRALTIGVPREIADNERRVALIPDTVKRLVAQGLKVIVETEAGTNAAYVDSAYSDAGATIVPDARSVYGEADTCEPGAQLRRRFSDLDEFLEPTEADSHLPPR